MGEQFLDAMKENKTKLITFMSHKYASIAFGCEPIKFSFYTAACLIGVNRALCKDSTFKELEKSRNFD